MFCNLKDLLVILETLKPIIKLIEDNRFSSEFRVYYLFFITL